MVGKEYAQAIYDLALANNVVDEIFENFKLFNELLIENKDYVKILTYPTIENKDKKRSLKSVLKGFDQLFLNFLFVLIDNNRFCNFNDIFDAYSELVYEKRGIIKVDIVSATKLTKNEMAGLNEKLSKYYGGKQIEANYTIDNGLKAGITVRTKNEVLSLSLKDKIESMENCIKRNSL